METVEMEIFRAGDYGAKGRYSEADLQAIAEDYRPELLEAPLTFDHAQAGPAYGWVQRLRAEGNRLVAVLGEVPEAVSELVRSGSYRRRSVELIRRLKETGRPYLRAVTLLGAATPEVKGLKPIAFSDEAEGTAVEFGGEDAPSMATDPPAAEPGIPHEDGQVCGAAAGPTGNVDAPTIASADEQVREADAAMEELQELREVVAQLRRDLRSQAVDALFADLRSEGYCLSPRDATALRHLAGFCEDESVQFAEGESQPLLDWLSAFIRSNALQVPLAPIGDGQGKAGDQAMHFHEDTAREHLDPAAVRFSPRTDPQSVERHGRAMTLLAQQPELSYAAALARVA